MRLKMYDRVHLRARWRCAVNIMFRRTYSRKGNSVPAEQEAGWASEPVLTFGEEKDLLPLPGLDPRTIQPGA
jgi:hypothetical protein